VAELRSFIFIDQLQPQTMCYLGSWIKGRLPRLNMAAQIIEIAPGMDIEQLTDVALKHDAVQAGILIVERQFGYLEIHSRSTAAVQSASSMLLPGETLFVLEMQPASYAILATNEAEKTANIKVIDYRMIGATGRVYLSGNEENVRAAADAAVAALGGVR
jgi:hypothetical protein